MLQAMLMMWMDIVARATGGAEMNPPVDDFPGYEVIVFHSTKCKCLDCLATKESV